MVPLDPSTSAGASNEMCECGCLCGCECPSGYLAYVNASELAGPGRMDGLAWVYLDELN
jgi:hypothetical protein